MIDKLKAIKYYNIKRC